MSHRQVHTATGLPRSPEEDRRRRMIQYTIAMSVRTVCLIAVVIVPDWWRVLPGIGAVVLPYFAVVIANVSSPGANECVVSPNLRELPEAHPDRMP